MGFLSPLLLALGAAVAVPIILHLFQRHQGPRVIFPALRYLRRAEKENARKIKLRQLLLMLLRIGAVALLALAAARPFARGAGSQHQPTAVAIVLDNSLSSGVIRDDRRLLDELEDRALASLEAAGPDDRFWLIRAGAPWEPALSGDPLRTAERVRETTPTAGAADLTSALAHARALLAAGAEGRAAEIHLLSDLQRTNLGAALEDGGAGPPVIVWVPEDEPPANRAVSGVEVAGGFAPIAGERSTVAIRVEGGAAFGDADSVAVRLNQDGRIVAAGWATPGAAAVLPFPPRPAGIVAGWAETDADALRADDRRYFSLRVREPPGVAVRGELPFVDDAFAVMERAGRLRRAPLDQAEVVLLPGAEGIETIAGATAVILPPESALELPAANRRLGAAGLPWRYGAANGAGEARFALEEGTDELLQTLDQVRLTQVYTLTKEGAAPADSVLLALSDGTPWAVRGERPNGSSYIVLASPLSASATTLPTSAAMVPLLDRVIGAWASARAIDGAFAPGAEAPLPAGTTAVLRPDDVEERVGDATHYALGSEPGIYRALAGDSTLAVFAVNPPAWESELARADARELASLLGDWDIEQADDPGEWASEIYRERLGREIWRPLLIAALLVLLIEAAVAAAGRLGANRGTRGREAAGAQESRTPDLAGAGQEMG